MSSAPPTASNGQPLRDAASVVLLREGLSGLQVLLLERHSATQVLGGAHVFPGGKRDEADTALAAPPWLDQAPQQLHQRLAEPALPVEHAASLFVAALRELWEECAVLLAEPQTGHLERATAGATGAFAQLLAGRGLRLQTAQLLPWSRWVTPLNTPVMRQRFDTRFFLALLPPGQEALPDQHEAVASVWLTPRAALAQYQDGLIDLVPPQIMSLMHLLQFDSAAQALQAARNFPPPLVQPEGVEENGQRVLCYPGDPRHPVATRALPGPTRLIYHEQRFSPPGGFAAWLD